MQKNSNSLKAEKNTSLILGRFPRIAISFERDGTTHLSLSDAFTCIGANEAQVAWLKQYAKGNAPLWQAGELGTLFQEKVLLAIQKIPFGQTESYKGIAELAGHPNAMRAVGSACKRNPFPLLIPCHRVISSNGEIGGFAMDLEIKRRLLEFEAGG